MIDRAEQLRQREEAIHTPKDRGRHTDAQWISLHKRAAELADAVLAHPAALLAAMAPLQAELDAANAGLTRAVRSLHIWESAMATGRNEPLVIAREHGLAALAEIERME